MKLRALALPILLLFALLPLGVHAAEPAFTQMIPLIVVSGFLDGLHPCGFAVLLFFIAFLLTLKRTRGQILRMGAAYIFGVFLAYFLIGLGLLKVFAFFPEPHFIAKVGAYLLVLLGFVNMKDYFAPGWGPSLGIPKFTKPFIEGAIEKATLPAALVAGFLVGLCAFPCAGGIYIAILGLIATTLNPATGLVYLALYNVMFVLPLILALALAQSKRVVNRLERLEQSEHRAVKLWTGVAMIALGLFILYGGILH